MKELFFVTGTDTGVGKTVLTALLAEWLRRHGTRVAALKPICSGGRGDAVALQRALGGALTLEQINPWHFRAALAPVVAARLEGKAVQLASVLAHIRTVRKNFEVTLVEGAGGLLSPLGADFNSRDLMGVLEATPLIVATNKLGAVNHVLLTLEALPKRLRARARVILVQPRRANSVSTTNVDLLRTLAVPEAIFELPWLVQTGAARRISKKTEVQQMLGTLLGK